MDKLESCLKEVDPEVAGFISREEARQYNILELIASENIVSPAVMAAMGTVLTNKYAEGYPGKRYYGGCEMVDQVEDLARESDKLLILRFIDTSFFRIQNYSFG